MIKKLIGAVAALLLLLAALPVSHAGATGSGESVQLPILMYHHMSVDSRYWSDYVVPPETLEGDLKYLQEHGYQTVSAQLLQLWCLGEAELPEKPVMITFDDGQLSFAEYAVPLLEQYGMCAVMNIVGKYADIYTETADENIYYAHMSWPKLTQIDDLPCVELGAHTYNMHDLKERRGCGKMNGETNGDYHLALNSDLEKLEGLFDDYLGYVPDVFAYPYGIYNDEALSVLRARGYNVIFTCDQHVNTLTGDSAELLSLGRFNRSNKLDRAKLFTAMGIN